MSTNENHDDAPIEAVTLDVPLRQRTPRPVILALLGMIGAMGGGARHGLGVSAAPHRPLYYGPGRDPLVPHKPRETPPGDRARLDAAARKRTRKAAAMAKRSGS